jgi:pyruvate dehydrogenase E1 component beta subunit
MPWTKLIADSFSMDNLIHRHGSERILAYGEAVSEAMLQAMDIDQDVIILGEGVATSGYIYDTTKEIRAIYGKDRVVETPIAEAAITGVCLGMAVAGMKPILIHMRNDFLLVSMDQIVNHIAHWKNIFGDDVPLVIRAIIARGWGSGFQHSNSYHALFSRFSGLDVVMPYTAYDVKGMFLSAVASKRPVLFLEHRWLYKDTDIVPLEPYMVPIGKAQVLKSGNDVTIVGFSISNREIAVAINKLNVEVDVEWIDLRTVYPIDIDTIVDSVKKTGRLIVVENGPLPCGIASEIAAQIMERVWGFLKAPIQRMGWKDDTVMAGEKLEKKIYYDASEISDRILKTVNYGK